MGFCTSFSVLTGEVEGAIGKLATEGTGLPAYANVTVVWQVVSERLGCLCVFWRRGRALVRCLRQSFGPLTTNRYLGEKSRARVGGLHAVALPPV